MPSSLTSRTDSWRENGRTQHPDVDDTHPRSIEHLPQPGLSELSKTSNPGPGAVTYSAQAANGTPSAAGQGSLA